MHAFVRVVFTNPTFLNINLTTRVIDSVLWQFNFWAHRKLVGWVEIWQVWSGPWTRGHLWDGRTTLRESV